MTTTSLPLAGRTALVTGVSRRRGIGFAVARALVRQGASLAVHHHVPHDLQQPWGGDDLQTLLDALRAELAPGAELSEHAADLAEPDAPQRLVAAANDALGPLHVLVGNHARSGSDGSILAMTPAMLDGHWAVNARSVILLTRFFAEQFEHPEGAPPPAGRVIWMTSGQLHGAMTEEVAYAASKAALAGATASVARELLGRGILLNTVNPGPVNTGYLDPETADRPLEVLERVASEMPLGRFGEPEDPARLIAWLASDEARWMAGQVLSTDGGFSL